jgi:hypothetical protein
MIIIAIIDNHKKEDRDDVIEMTKEFIGIVVIGMKKKKFAKTQNAVDLGMRIYKEFRYLSKIKFRYLGETTDLIGQIIKQRHLNEDKEMIEFVRDALIFLSETKHHLRYTLEKLAIYVKKYQSYLDHETCTILIKNTK